MLAQKLMDIANSTVCAKLPAAQYLIGAALDVRTTQQTEERKFREGQAKRMRERTADMVQSRIKAFEEREASKNKKQRNA